jgi:hypothetical protein
LSWPAGQPGPAERRLRLRSRSVVAAFGRQKVLQTAEMMFAEGALVGLCVWQGTRAEVRLVFKVEGV